MNCMPAASLKGSQFGFLEVWGRAGSQNGKALWRCRCRCGGETLSTTGNLRAGRVTSCGCKRLALIHAAHKKNPVSHRVHGFRSRTSGNPLYAVWTAIKQRCCNPRNWAYLYYGGRGIRLCGAWMSNPAAFIAYIDAELGPRPSRCHSIDRKNNDGNYEPGNLRWATRIEQSRNRRPFRNWRKT